MTSGFVMPFGKHKGVPVTELDGGYLHWLHSKIGEWREPLLSAVGAEVERRKAAATTAPEAPPPRVQPAAGATVCTECGLAASAGRPLVLMHRGCAREETPF